MVLGVYRAARAAATACHATAVYGTDVLLVASAVGQGVLDQVDVVPST